MHETETYLSSPPGSFTSLYGGYAPLKNEQSKATPGETDSNSKSCACSNAFFSFLYRFLIAFLRFLCFRLPRNIDSESLLTVEYKNECAGEELECALINDDLTEFVTIGSKNSVRHFDGMKRKHSFHQDICGKPKTTAVTVNEIKASQVKGYVIASKGKDQMCKTRMAVSKSKQQLRQVQDDIVNIRDNIETAKKLFTEVEKGIQDYKWESISRQPWANIEYRGELCYFPTSSSVRYITPMEQMYIDHKIFVEEMKFHFKWNHGILL